jgi:chaperonin GroEL
MKRDPIFGKEARDKIKEGVDTLAKAVSVTLGIRGKNVVICEAVETGYGLQQLPPRLTKDGVTGARQVKMEDLEKNVGVMLLREAAEKTVFMAGDGTTTTVVLAAAIVNEGINAIDAGLNSMEIKRGIDNAVLQVVELLKAQSTPVSGNIEKIRNVATVSANNDSSIGDLIAQAYEKIGEDGVIALEESKGLKTEIKISEGFEFDTGYISPYFINRPGKMICEFENPYILLFEKKIISWKSIESIVVQTMNEGRPLVIICEDIEGEALAALSINNAQKKISVCAVKAPFFDIVRTEAMEDLSALTGATYLSDVKGVKLENATVRHLGTCKSIKVSKENTVIVGGDKDDSKHTELLNELKMNLTQAKEEREKTIIQNRIARLEGGIAVLSIGGVTEVEMKERMDRADDAVRATKSACEEGFLPGGGTAFLRCEIAIDGRESKSFQAGQEIVQSVLAAPLTQICINAGIEPTHIVNQVMFETGAMGYNAQTEKVENLIQSGIIDATKVLRCAITNAASVAGLILTMECMLADRY